MFIFTPISCNNTLARCTFIHSIDLTADGNVLVTHENIVLSTAYRKEHDTTRLLVNISLSNETLGHFNNLNNS